MKKNLFHVAAWVFGAAAMTSVGHASTTACATVDGNAAAVYAAYGSDGCVIGDKVFSNFTFTNSSVWINITPLNPDPLHEGFQFGGAFATTGSNFVASVFYDVRVIGGADLIRDMELSVGGIGTIPQGTLFDIGEDITHNGNLIGSLDVGNFGQPLKLTDHAAWRPVNSIHVAKDVSIYPCGLGNNGIDATTACNTSFNFSEITQIVSQVPEPMTFSLMGVGLLGLGLLRKRLS